MSILLDLKSALLTLLNGHTWSQPFTATWVYQPEIELADLLALNVVVLPASVKRSRAARGYWENDYVYHLGIRKRASQSVAVEPDGDAQMTLWEEVAAFLEKTPLATTPPTFLVENTVVPYVQDDIREKRLFTSILALTYRVVT